MRGKLIVGNWKMNGNRESVRALLSHIAAMARIAVREAATP